MSLDVYLYLPSEESPREEMIIIERDGILESVSRESWVVSVPHHPYEIYTANITHNLGQMAAEAGIYKALWRPEEIGIRYAKQIVPILEKGLRALKHNPEHFKAFEGKYESLLRFVERYLHECRGNPEAFLRASR